MSYTADGQLADLWPEDLPSALAVETARRVAEELEERVAERTPVAEIPEAYSGSYGSWIGDRKGRRPGTMKRSWRRTPPRVRPGPSVSVTVYNEDDRAQFVEWDTRPHIIRARNRGGLLRFPMGSNFLYRRQVSHPGTEGVHMMRDSLAEMEIRWAEIALGVLEELTGGPGGGEVYTLASEFRRRLALNVD
jgi:hypothetical protein